MAQEQERPIMNSQVIGKGNPVVLVPGGLTGWLSWEPHAELLSKQYQVTRTQLLSVDLGLKNEPFPPNYSVDYETQALTNTLDDLKIRQADFAAWSYGAEVTLNFALNNPDRIRTLTLIEPPAIWVLKSRGALPGKLLDEQKQIQELGPGDITEEQLVWFTHFAGFVPQNVDPKTLPQWPIWLKHRQSLRTQDVVFRQEDTIERVRMFKKPVLLFKGEGSSDFLHQIIDILGEEFPNIQVEKLAGGHAPHIVSMDKFMKIFNTFLETSQNQT